MLSLHIKIKIRKISPGIFFNA